MDATLKTTGTRKQLLTYLDDFEMISRELLDTVCSGKAAQSDSLDAKKLTQLLITKQKDINEAMKTASEQAETQRRMEQLKVAIAQQEEHMLRLQTSLREAERILSTIVYQARSQLEALRQASEQPVQSQEVIQFAHRISASYSASAPPGWQQGDPRRPFPTSFEMNRGALVMPQTGIVPNEAGAAGPVLQTPLTPWHQEVGVPFSFRGGTSASPPPSVARADEQQDVELMSSADSDSSSSSDD